MGPRRTRVAPDITVANLAYTAEELRAAVDGFWKGITSMTNNALIDIIMPFSLET